VATTLLTVMIGELSFRRSRTSEDFAAARSSLSALAFFGRDDAVQHGQLAEAAFARGELALAAEQHEASLSRGPTPQGWLGLAQVAEQRDLWQKAAEAYAAAAQLDPAPALLLHKAGVAWRRAADPASAVPLLEKAVALQSDNKLLRSVLDRARRDASHPAGTAARGTF
jgi:tetratricopeptide (TPR) repeat protein